MDPTLKEMFWFESEIPFEQSDLLQDKYDVSQREDTQQSSQEIYDKVAECLNHSD